MILAQVFLWADVTHTKHDLTHKHLDRHSDRLSRAERRDVLPARPRGRGTARSQPVQKILLGWLREHYFLATLWTALLLAFLAEMPWIPRSLRTIALQVVVVGFCTFLAVSGPYQADAKTVLRRGPSLLLAVLLAWCALSAVLAPYRAFAVAELLRMFLCGAVYFAAAYGLRRDELRLAAGGVLAVGTALALYGASQFSSVDTLVQGNIASIFGNHEPFGSFLALLLPLALTFGLDSRSPERERIAGLVATLVIGGALLLSLTRSAWIGSAVGLMTLAGLTVRFAPPRLTRANKALLVGPILVVCLAFAGLIVAGQFGSVLSPRAATLSHVMQDGSFAERLLRWRQTCRMTAARPVAGWGLGSYPVLQNRWTHEGDAAPEVLANGTGLQNIAHNFWVQWAAETGGVGVALYVGAVAAFLGVGLTALRGLPAGGNRTLLLGCLAVTVASCVDGISAPTHTFPGISVLFWFWIGLGVAACRGAALGSLNGVGPPTRVGSVVTEPPTSRGVWLGAGAAGLTAALIILGVGFAQH